MKVLNLGCGTKTSERVINIDWSIYLRVRKNRMLFAVAAPLFFKGERRKKLKDLDRNIVLHNLAKGIPYSSNSIDAVYHSHFLEHLTKSQAKSFFAEVKRVLKPGGVHRVVVPDFEKLCVRYTEHIQICNNDPTKWSQHDDVISSIILQMVREEAYGTSQQSPIRRFVENMILGNARKRGEVHRWMYDRFNLHELLKNCGFKDISVETFKTSKIPGWENIGLDCDESNNEYKPISLYMEAIK